MQYFPDLNYHPVIYKRALVHVRKDWYSKSNQALRVFSASGSALLLDCLEIEKWELVVYAFAHITYIL